MKKTLRLTRYDAELSTDMCDSATNAELTIRLRLGFRQVNPAAGAAAGTYHDYGDATEPTRKIVQWTTSTWNAWKSNFVLSAQRYWDGKFWLLNRRGVLPYNTATGIYIPNVFCRFNLVGSDASAGHHHHVIDVVRLDATETWFGSHSTLYDSLDTNLTQKRTDSHGHAVMQRAHVHEVGHLLGLDHVDVGTAACPATGDTNAAVCYGTSDTSMNDVMGGGMTLHLWHANPWMSAMTSHLRYITPSTVYTPAARLVQRFEPKMARCFPRTVAEFEANTLISSR